MKSLEKVFLKHAILPGFVHAVALDQVWGSSSQSDVAAGLESGRGSGTESGR